MKRYLLLSLVLLASCLSFAQTQDNVIEIGVNEIVELKAELVTVSISVASADYQMEEMRDNYYYSEEEYEYESYWEEDYEYEQLLEESPDEITDDMKKRYKERQKEKKKLEAERELRSQEWEKKEEAFVPYTLNKLMSLLDENGISYTISSNAESNDYYEEEYYEQDSSLHVVLNSETEFNKLESLLKDLPARPSLADVSFESIDKYYADVIPALTEKAKKQADLLAKALNKKVGQVLSCSNAFPYMSSPALVKRIMNNDPYDRLERRRGRGDSNPFKSTQEEIVEYLFRFQLVD